MTNYSNDARAKDFPAPVAKVTSESPLWDWATVARWMFRNNKLGREAAIDAEIVKQANAVIDDGGGDMARRLKKKAREVAAALDAACTAGHPREGGDPALLAKTRDWLAG